MKDLDCINPEGTNSSICISTYISRCKKGIYDINSSKPTVIKPAGNETSVNCEEMKEMKRGQGKECISFCYLTQH